MKYQEHAVSFACAGDRLLGILSEPAEPYTVGVLVIVGGPQYRVGSHRQFVLLARYLAERGYPVFRFDYRGMGDSAGAVRTFDEIYDDIASAIGAFTARLPAVRSLVLWGLCDAASAVMMNAPKHAMVKGLVLLNPWAWAEETHAQTRLRHYYLSRFFSASFWHKLVTGRVRLGDSTRSLAKTVAVATRANDAPPDYRRAMAEGFGSLPRVRAVDFERAGSYRQRIPSVCGFTSRMDTGAFGPTRTTVGSCRRGPHVFLSGWA